MIDGSGGMARSAAAAGRRVGATGLVLVNQAAAADAAIDHFITGNLGHFLTGAEVAAAVVGKLVGLLSRSRLTIRAEAAGASGQTCGRCRLRN
mmetsp:Transcript_8936/g.14182  ORF Transcript_8936/g.14182 Transcript_8936/m.14182 type:complete len:93 (-) Transcript_8936:689-967(-)